MSFEVGPALFGLLVGFLVGLTGVGGGSLMTPFLLSLGIPAPTAIGTDMVYATATKMSGSVQHYWQRSINLEVAVFLGIGSIPASLLGVQTLEWIKGSYDAERVDAIMTSVIAATLILVGASLIFRNFMPKEWTTGRKKSEWDGKSAMSLKRRLFTIVFGAMGGYLVGLTSIGSGSVMAVILLLLYPMAPAVIVGTDIAHATVLSLVTGISHLAHGNVDLGLVGTLLVGSIPGVLIGSRVAPWLPSRPLTLILAAMIIFVGVRLLI